ncbi:hypothetical protein A0H81_11715 [Grifola frondosa]|uniref:Uncharacterized protein n=1 Tax=Grifola frondosa TaxID=5627 RepID=A0A1C7LVJ1_GRIFR|nr:hypothetical protein A0H81_11715 [Grifola frondosa]
MSDRRTHQLPPNTNVCLSSQWTGNAQYPSGYPASQDQYPAASYPVHPSLRSTAQAVPPYAAMPTQTHAMSSQAAYPMADAQLQYPLPHGSDRRSSMSMSMPQQYAAYGMDSQQQAMSMAQVSGRHQSSHSNPYPSHSAPHHYAAQSSSSPQQSPVMSNVSVAQYSAAQAAYAQQMSNSQYPASPPRPFACDMKDALKRHQLVKRCGIDEGA